MNERTVDRWTMRALLAVLILLAVGFFFDPPTCHAGDSPWSATSFSVGGQGRWLSRGGLPNDSQVEAVGNVAFSLTPHVSLTGGVAYGFQDAYARSQVDARITASNPDDENFNVWVGAGRYFTRYESDGLDEWAGKGGIGWRLFDAKPFILGATSAYGFDTGRQCFSASLVYVFKIARSNNTAVVPVHY